MRQPDVPFAIAGNREDRSGGHAADRPESALVHIAHAQTGQPDPAAFVLKQSTPALNQTVPIDNAVYRPRRRAPRQVIREVRKLVVDRDASVVPVLQAIEGADPDTAVCRGDDGHDLEVGKTLPLRKLRPSGLAKAIEPTTRTD